MGDGGYCIKIEKKDFLKEKKNKMEVAEERNMWSGINGRRDWSSQCIRDLENLNSYMSVFSAEIKFLCSNLGKTRLDRIENNLISKPWLLRSRENSWDGWNYSMQEDRFPRTAVDAGVLSKRSRSRRFFENF